MNYFIVWKDPQGLYHHFSTHSEVQSCRMPSDDWSSADKSIHQVKDPRGSVIAFLFS